MIKVEQLSKSFGKIRAVQDVSFSALDGQITGLLGPNGAGKSTTLRMIYTLLKPDSGVAYIDEIDISQFPIEARSRIGVLSDAQGVYDRLTTRENIRYFGQLQGMNDQDLENRMDELLIMLDMMSIADRRAKGFSTGERLKVAIARAIVHNPNNILLDEPTNGLDVKSTRTMREFIRKLRDDGKCIVLTSHIMQEVAALCDKIIIISNGAVAAQGTPDEILNKTRKDNLEDAFIEIIGSEEGLA
ncbi:MAG: ATP-binding cassette domain-containing protein [Anaerolineae bacterium]|jgi:sodium transport system ATP-binding protein|nr:ATP-binding cassette domain-containing protein [Anaerolineae bacterium]MBT7190918.1 ATP-binding cassette domain-containing protein [Anaerolineae bacterium]MBT7715543.1 ATP-binding cassette domain-containing protein [Deltaproteobacteria bacterium]